MSEKQPILHAVVVSAEPGDDFPKGQWRDGLCDCCSYCCRPICWNTWCCSSCLLAQVMGRVGLDALGEPTTAQLARNTFCRVISIVVATYVVQSAMYEIFPTEKNCYPLDLDDADDVLDDDTLCVDEFVNPNVQILYNVIEGLLGLYILILICRTRSAIRKKSGIAGSDCEDCLYTWFCGCCTIGQMARHTADYDTQDDACCSFNGLAV